MLDFNNSDFWEINKYSIKKQCVVGKKKKRRSKKKKKKKKRENRVALVFGGMDDMK